MSLIDVIAESIVRQEGTGCGSRNNPGNLRTWGDLPTSSGFAVFPTCEAGWDALRRQVQRNVDRGLTLEEFFAGKAGVYPGYAPAADSNQPYVYASNVALWTGIPLGVPLIALENQSYGFEFFNGAEMDPTVAVALVVVGTVLIVSIF